MIASGADRDIIKTIIETNIENNVLKNKTIIIFGCTLYAKDIQDILLSFDISASAFIDNNCQKIGKKCLGLDVYSPNKIPLLYKENIVFVVCSKYNFEMKRQLELLGYSEKNILEIPVRESKKGNDSLEQLNRDWNLIRRGYYLYKKIIEKYSVNHKIFICPYRGTGDVYMACAFLPEYLRQENIQAHILLVIGNSCLRTASLFGIENIVVLSSVEAELILKAWEFLGNTKMNLKPLLYWGWRVKRYLYADQYPQITFTEMFRHDVFDLDISVKPTVPMSKADNTYAKRLFQKMDLKKGQTIIIAPYAGSFVPNISMESWESLTELLKEKGYCVCTNCFGDKESPIYGTQPIIFPYEEAKNVLEYAGGFIAVRSGLCDIVSSANCKMVIIYENGFNASRYEYFSLRKMGLNDSVEEFVFDNDTVENIVNVF